MANATHGVELGLDVIEAQVDLATIGLEFGFTRAADFDASSELRHGAASAGEARELVFKLVELNLDLTFGGTGVTREDVED